MSDDNALATRIAAIEEMMDRRRNDGDAQWENAYQAIYRTALVPQAPASSDAARVAADHLLHTLAKNIAVGEAAGKQRCPDWDLPQRLLGEVQHFQAATRTV